MKIFLMPLFLLISQISLAEVHIIEQKNKKFSMEKLTIKVGDSVDFLNSDPFFHNVFSLSDNALFDLGSYPKGESRRVTFEEAGKVVIECAIHPSMIMEITVE